MNVQVTQFMRPNGRRKLQPLVIPDEYQKQYDLILSCDCELTCEQLMSGIAVQYISHPLGDFKMKSTPPHKYQEAKDALIQMVKEFDIDEFKEWKKQQEDIENAIN